MNSTASSIGTILDVLQSKLDALNKDIESDAEGKKEYEDQLKRLQIQKEDCQRRLAKNKAFAAKFDKDIGPFEKMYTNMTGNMEQLYSNAKIEHAKGVEVLKKEFKYHPMYVILLHCVYFRVFVLFYYTTNDDDDYYYYIYPRYFTH